MNACVIKIDLVKLGYKLLGWGPSASKLIEENGGKVRAVIATHGLFVGTKANSQISELMDRNIKVIVTDTIHKNRLDNNLQKKMIVISTVNLFGEAIRCIQQTFDFLT